MPHVRRSMLIWVAADSDHVQRAFTDELHLVAAEGESDGAFEGPIAGMPDTSARLVASIVESNRNGDSWPTLSGSTPARIHPALA